MKQLGWCSIEQSKKLMEAGLDPKTADMSWEKTANHLKEEFSWQLFFGPNPVVQMNSFSFRNGYVLPCWSLGALIELMPQTNSYETFIDIVHNRVVFAPCDDDIIVEEGKNANYVDADTLIDAIVSMTLWLLENNYIKKETK